MRMLTDQFRPSISETMPKPEKLKFTSQDVIQKKSIPSFALEVVRLMRASGVEVEHMRLAAVYRRLDAGFRAIPDRYIHLRFR